MLTLPFTVTYLLTNTVWKYFTHSKEYTPSFTNVSTIHSIIHFLDNSDFDLKNYLVYVTLAYFANINRVIYSTPATCSTDSQWSVVDVSGVTHN